MLTEKLKKLKSAFFGSEKDSFKSLINSRGNNPTESEIASALLGAIVKTGSGSPVSGQVVADYAGQDYVRDAGEGVVEFYKAKSTTAGDWEIIAVISKATLGSMLLKTGAEVPTNVTPDFKGQIYQNTETNIFYLATSTAKGGWSAVPLTALLVGQMIENYGAGVPTNVPVFRNQIYYDTTNDEFYLAKNNTGTSDWVKMQKATE